MNQLHIPLKIITKLISKWCWSARRWWATQLLILIHKFTASLTCWWKILICLMQWSKFSCSISREIAKRMFLSQYLWHISTEYKQTRILGARSRDKRKVQSVDNEYKLHRHIRNYLSKVIISCEMSGTESHREEWKFLAVCGRQTLLAL